MELAAREKPGCALGDDRGRERRYGVNYMPEECSWMLVLERE